MPIPYKAATGFLRLMPRWPNCPFLTWDPFRKGSQGFFGRARVFKPVIFVMGVDLGGLALAVAAAGCNGSFGLFQKIKRVQDAQVRSNVNTKNTYIIVFVYSVLLMSKAACPHDMQCLLRRFHRLLSTCGCV